MVVDKNSIFRNVAYKASLFTFSRYIIQWEISLIKYYYHEIKKRMEA